VLFEFGGRDLLLDQGEDATALTLEQLLPHAFGPNDTLTRTNQ
jgi:cytidine deaminase